jgi:polar amino acid transport system ATP-binding protein
MTEKADNRARFGASPDAMVFARGVRKSFGSLEVLKGIDLTVPTGSVACIIGPSGSGKSTFLRCVNHLEALSGGVLLVDGEFVGYDLRDGKLHEVANRRLCARRADIGMVFQSFNLFAHMTVMENLIEAPIRVRGASVAEASPTRSAAIPANCRADNNSGWRSRARSR